MSWKWGEYLTALVQCMLPGSWIYNKKQCAKVVHLHCNMITSRITSMSHALFKRTHKSIESQLHLLYERKHHHTDLSGVRCVCLEDDLAPLRYARMSLWSIASDKTELLSSSASAAWMSRPPREPFELLQRDGEENRDSNTGWNPTPTPDTLSAPQEGWERADCLSTNTHASTTQNIHRWTEEWQWNMHIYIHVSFFCIYTYI